MMNILREIFILKVASALGVGPHFENILSFDAIKYQNCVHVAMEFCQFNYSEEVIEAEMK